MLRRAPHPGQQRRNPRLDTDRRVDGRALRGGGPGRPDGSCRLHPLMTAGWGRIVNVASIMGLRGQRDAISYSTAKGGIVAFTRALAADLGARGITVNAIAPGFIDSRMALLPDGTHEHATEWFREVYLKHGRILLGRAGVPED